MGLYICRGYTGIWKRKWELLVRFRVLGVGFS